MGPLISLFWWHLILYENKATHTCFPDGCQTHLLHLSCHSKQQPHSQRGAGAGMCAALCSARFVGLSTQRGDAAATSDSFPPRFIQLPLSSHLPSLHPAFPLTCHPPSTPHLSSSPRSLSQRFLSADREPSCLQQPSRMWRKQVRSPQILLSLPRWLSVLLCTAQATVLRLSVHAVIQAVLDDYSHWCSVTVEDFPADILAAFTSNVQIDVPLNRIKSRTKSTFLILGWTVEIWIGSAKCWWVDAWLRVVSSGNFLLIARCHWDIRHTLLCMLNLENLEWSAWVETAADVTQLITSNYRFHYHFRI